MLGVVVIVQGAAYNASYIDSRIAAFVEGFPDTLLALSDADLVDTIRAVKLQKEKP